MVRQTHRLTARRAGFTLIELLVVIAIIAILAAILFPVFANARERGRQTMCFSNMKNLYLSFRSYMDDNKSRMPSVNWTTDTRTVDWAGTKVFRQALLEQGSLWPYVREEKVYRCPTDKNKPATKITEGDQRKYRLSYAVNEMLGYRNVDSLTKSPTLVLLMIHEARDSINDGYFDWDYQLPRPAQSGATGAPDRMATVHYDGTCVLYLDGHAQRKSNAELERERTSQDPLNTTVYNWDVY